MTTTTLSPLVPDEAYAAAADRATLDRVAAALERRGLRAQVLRSGAEARRLVQELIPDGATVYDPASRTMLDTGIAADIRAATRYRATRAATETLDRRTQIDEFRRHVSTMDVVVGSVHAVTEDGEVVIASASGSQLASYVFGAGEVIWVVGAQKVVPDLDTAFSRIERYSYPLEDARAREVYGMPSAINKRLVVSGDLPGRTTVLLLEEAVGF